MTERSTASTTASSRIAGVVLLVGLLSQGASALTRKTFDFVVGVDGDFKAAMAAAAKKASASYRYHVFFPDGDYGIGSLTGDANQMTTFPTSNVSLVGQSATKTVIFNSSVSEGIGITATLYFKGANNLYLQDLTILNKANYGIPSTYSQTGRHVAVMEQGNQMVYRNVRLLSTQDTYYTKGTRTYWEGGEIHGTTDFICGGGDVFFNGVLLYALKKSAMTAPATSTSWGYVFRNCTIDGDVNGFTLGRSWGDARAVYLETTMKQLPVETGWGDPMNSVPKVFAEYKSRNASGALLDLGKRRTSYTKGTVTVTLDPVLDDAEAAKYTVANVLGGSDSWQPQEATRQVAAPTIRQEGSALKWSDDPAALCWVVFRNGKYLANVATTGFDLSATTRGDEMTVRAANAMGGLGAASNAIKVGVSTGVPDLSAAPEAGRLRQRGRSLVVDGLRGTTAELVLVDASGNVRHRAALAAEAGEAEVDLAASGLRRGLYWAVVRDGSGRRPATAVRIVD